VSGFLAFQLRFDGWIPETYLQPMVHAIAIWLPLQWLGFVLARLHRGNWRFVSVHDVRRILWATGASSVLSTAVLILIFGADRFPRSVFILNWILVSALCTGMRFAVRSAADYLGRRDPQHEGVPTLIYGAGAAGVALLWELRQNRSLNSKVVGFIDDDPSKASLVLKGAQVFGPGESLVAVVRKQAVEKVLIAIPSATGAEMARILGFVLEAGVEYKTVPGMAELIEGTELGKQIRPVAVDDLLGRQPVQIDQEGIRAQLQGKMILVTGAAGSIGSELCRQIANFRPLGLVGFDAAETPLFHIDRELKNNFPDLKFYPELGNITKQDDLERVMQQYRPAVLCHAAAYKHVPMMEMHVFAAVENNIFGTWNVAMAAAEAGVEDFVMISTDKAVGPSSVMGASKRVAEMVIRALQNEYATRFVSVRFGNVLGSNGSVVPIFKEQIAAGGPVTVTHPEVTRYFMTIPEASRLVLQALSFRKFGELFVLDMGEPIKIVELARNLIVLSGLRPGHDIPIEFTGLRPGEKLFEELNLHEEQLVATAHRKIKSFVSSAGPDIEAIENLLHDLRNIVQTRDAAKLVILLKQAIPDYNPSSELRKYFLPQGTASSMPGRSDTDAAIDSLPFGDLNPSVARS
jgi:FlaA1/EpsC-like NDP-sugar epimerase